MQKRLVAFKRLFERQSEHRKIEEWAEWVLPYAKEVGRGDDVNHAIAPKSHHSDSLGDTFATYDVTQSQVAPRTCEAGRKKARKWKSCKVSSAFEGPRWQTRWPTAPLFLGVLHLCVWLVNGGKEEITTIKSASHTQLLRNVE